MVRRRNSHTTTLDFSNTTQAYQWDSETEIGFTEAELLFDRDGKLVGVDYRTPRTKSRQERETH